MKTKPIFSRSIRALAPVLLLSSPWASAKFVPPSDAAPFRRDQLPIDVETMSQLSRQLSILTATLDVENVEEQRTAAQLLALSQALDPVNPRVEELMDKFKDEENPENPGNSELTIAKTRAWRTQSWLASDEAGKDGKILASCLADTLAKIDPTHPSAAAHKEEQGKWTNWVAPAEAFIPKEKPDIADSDDDEKETSDEEMDDDKSEDDEDKIATEFVLQAASIQTPVWVYNENKEDYTLKLTTISMQTSTDEEHPEFRYHLEGVDTDKIRPILLEVNKNSVPILEERNQGLPEGGVVTLSLPKNETYSIKRNGTNIGAAAAVLASAALNGEVPTGIVIGTVEKDGKLAFPANGWELVRLLELAPPSRVILPKSTAELLPGLLVLDHMDWFMKHDIFLADNVEELITLSKKTPDKSIAEGMINFADIRKKAPATIGPFIANPYVSKRLETIAASTPSYASAQYLLMQSRGKRPAYLSSKVLAHEIRRALAPMNAIARDMQEAGNKQLKDMDAEAIQAAHESSRTALDPLEKLVSSEDRDIYAEAMDLANTARTLARAIKKIGERGFNDGEKGFHDKSGSESLEAISKGLPSINQQISFILGEPREEKARRDK